MDIISWKTWKRRNPDVRDHGTTPNTGSETAEQALDRTGYTRCATQSGHGLFSKERPKDIAVRLVRYRFGKNRSQGKEFVYHHGRRKETSMDFIRLYFKEKN